MYEIIKTVNGHQIKKLNGGRSYDVHICEGNGWREFISFRSIEDAVAFIEKEMPPQ